jgi:hypothetical protein
MTADQICVTNGIEELETNQNTPIATARIIFLETSRVAPGYRIRKKPQRRPCARRWRELQRRLHREHRRQSEQLNACATSQQKLCLIELPAASALNQNACRKIRGFANFVKFRATVQKYFTITSTQGHQSRRAIAKVTPHCTICDRDLESHQHLSRHLKSKNHYKTATQITKYFEKEGLTNYRNQNKNSFSSLVSRPFYSFNSHCLSKSHSGSISRCHLLRVISQLV